VGCERDTEAVADRRPARRWPLELQRRAPRKLRLLDVAEHLDDLRNPPGNRLERLRGGRAGQSSIRV